MTKKMTDWKTAFELKSNLTQGDVVAFEKALFALPRALLRAQHSNIAAETALCAAIEAGWIESPACEVGEFGEDQTKAKRWFVEGTNIAALHPGKVRWYGAQVDALYNTITEPPPN